MMRVHGPASLNGGVGPALLALLTHLPVATVFAAEPTRASVGASYTGDLYRTASGGLRDGSTYTGLANLSVGFTAASWKAHGDIFLPHGESPTAEHLGDLSVVSNIDTGGLGARVHELWVERAMASGSVRAGMLASDNEFWGSEYAGLFSNGAFGAPQIVALNLPGPPVFPAAALGVRVQRNLGAGKYLRVSVQDGDSGDLVDENPHGLTIKLNGAEGALVLAEFQLDQSESAGAAKGFRVGFVHHTARFERLGTGDVQRGLWGAYAVIDRPLSEHVAWFSRVWWSQSKVSIVPWSLESGLVLPGFAGSRGTFGVAVSYTALNRDAYQNNMDPLKSESVLALTYALPISPYFNLQPEAQYIFNTGGRASGGKTLAIGLRLKFQL